MRKWISLMVASLLLLGMLGCTADPQEDQNTVAEGFTLTNAILGEEYQFTYTQVPQRTAFIGAPFFLVLLRNCRYSFQ